MTRVKKILLGVAGFLVTVPTSGLAEENKEPTNNTDTPLKEQQNKNRLSKDELVKALKEMKRNPEELSRPQSAMCYDMAAPPDSTEFQCPVCGQQTTYAAGSSEYDLAYEFSYLNRSLTDIPYQISLDSSGLCASCSKGKNKSITAHVACSSCGKEFSWEIKNKTDCYMFRWLYHKLPLQKIEKEKEEIVKGADYLREHVFCPACRKNIRLD
ncbi:MAG: hypothetical protein V1746_05035 [bacterium]